MVLKDDNDFQLIGELYRLSDRYDVSRLECRIADKLDEILPIFLDISEVFEEVWLKLQSISKIAFEFKIEKLMDKVSNFIYHNMENILTQDNEELFQLNDTTDGQLFGQMIHTHYSCFQGEETEKIKEKMIDLFVLFTEKWKHLNDILSQVKSFKCGKCGSLNHVHSIDNSSKCQECDQLFFDIK